MYSLMCAAELLTVRVGPKTSNPHLDATGQQQLVSYHMMNLWRKLRMITKDFVADIVLLNEVSEQFLIGAILVSNLDQSTESKPNSFDSSNFLFDLLRYPRTYNLARSPSEELARLVQNRD